MSTGLDAVIRPLRLIVETPGCDAVPEERPPVLLVRHTVLEIHACRRPHSARAAFIAVAEAPVGAALDLSGRAVLMHERADVARERHGHFLTADRCGAGASG